ncbi:MAG TPA: inorganic diphosphatase [Steroidobacteraceae bacterium]
MPVPQSTIPPRDGRSSLTHVIIDTPGGSRNKFKFDDELRIFTISRILPRGLHFPYDFGSVPGTCAADGDPLDVLVIAEAPTFPGCLIKVRLIGGIRAQQREGTHLIRNDRLIAVPQTAVNPAPISSINSLAAAQLHEIEQFFISYNRAQGRELRIHSRFTAATAERLLSAAIRACQRHERQRDSR